MIAHPDFTVTRLSVDVRVQFDELGERVAAAHLATGWGPEWPCCKMTLVSADLMRAHMHVQRVPLAQLKDMHGQALLDRLAPLFAALARADNAAFRNKGPANG